MLLSVLTATVGRWPGFVVEAGESLARQELPAEWRLEWIVQEDGPDPGLSDVVGRFPFARYEANGHQLGLAATRNMGLVRVNGSIVQVLDGDDVMLPGGCGAVARAFQENPAIHWVATQADNLMPDGTRVSFEPISPTGCVEPGVVNDFVLTHGRGPFLFNGIALHTATVRALGGWLAEPVEDFGLVAAISEVAAGYYTPQRTYLYRQHDGQLTRHEDWEAVRLISVDMVRKRIGALRTTGLRIGAA